MWRYLDDTILMVLFIANEATFVTSKETSGNRSFNSINYT